MPASRYITSTVGERARFPSRRLVGFGPRMYGTPANTADTEPSDTGWCARVGLLSALRLMNSR